MQHGVSTGFFEFLPVGFAPFVSRFLQHQPKGNNYNPNRHLMQHLYCACVVALLSTTVEKALWMQHLEFPEMKAEVVVIALSRVPISVSQSVERFARLSGGEKSAESCHVSGLVAPYRAILRYYRCDTPYRAILLQGG